MKIDLGQSYQYKGIDLWGARCGLMHRYSGSSRNSDLGACKIFQHHNGPDHIYNPVVDANVVFISVPRLIRDFCKGMDPFLCDVKEDRRLWRRMSRRIGNVFHVSHLNRTT